MIFDMIINMTTGIKPVDTRTIGVIIDITAVIFIDSI